MYDSRSNFKEPIVLCDLFCYGMRIASSFMLYYPTVTTFNGIYKYKCGNCGQERYESGARFSVQFKGANDL